VFKSWITWERSLRFKYRSTHALARVPNPRRRQIAIGKQWPQSQSRAWPKKVGKLIPEALLAHLSPLKWEHINLTGDYRWSRDGGLRNRKLRPLRTAFAPFATVP